MRAEGSVNLQQAKKRRTVEIEKGAPRVGIGLLALLSDFVKGEKYGLIHEARSRRAKPLRRMDCCEAGIKRGT